MDERVTAKEYQLIAAQVLKILEFRSQSHF